MKVSESPDPQSASQVENHWFMTPVQRSTGLRVKRAKVSIQV